MKRFALAMILLTAAGVAVFLALNRPGAEASPDPTITVDTTFDNDHRDDMMTLPEAIKLATGDLTLADLTFSECEQVSGTLWGGAIGCISPNPPGAASADTIVFDTSVFPPGSPQTITLGCGALPLLDTGDDTVDGSAAGVIVEGQGTSEFDCFDITSNNNTIKGLEIHNCRNGVFIRQDVHDNTIGGSAEAARNVISGNSTGVRIGPGSDHNTVKNNYIGTNAAGDAPIPNDGHGVYIFGGAENNDVGGTGPGRGNVIAFNGGDGVRVEGYDVIGNTIRFNSIHSNGGQGIHLVDGGNTELDSPTITGFGSAMGTACPNCIIDVYCDDEDEGKVYQGSTTADGSGNWSFSGTPEGPNITATATDLDGNTSEFSAPVAVPEPTPTPTPSPTPEAIRTLVWGSGWQNAVWSGASTPEEAFACAAGNYAAAYRLVGGGWERYFPDRPELSNMTDLVQYDAFLILVTGDVTCEMPVADSPGTERTLDWGVGWQNDGWSGADGTTPQDAFACAEGSYVAAYRLVSGGWERYFPDRPDISNMGPLDKYDAFLILTTAPVSCTMAIAP
jgi:hypothetical protein